MQGEKLLVLALVLAVHITARKHHHRLHHLNGYKNANVTSSLSKYLVLPESGEKKDLIGNDSTKAKKRNGGENAVKIGKSGKPEEKPDIPKDTPKSGASPSSIAPESSATEKEQLQTKLDSIKNQVKAVKDDPSTNIPSSLILSTNLEDPLKNIKLITGGISAMLPGLEKLADGIRKKDKFLIATSALTIAAGVATAVGGPIGVIVAVVLNLAKTLIEIFKPREEVESQEEMLKRVIKDALREFREDDLLGNFNGFTRKSEMISNNLKEVDFWLRMGAEGFDDGNMKAFVDKSSGTGGLFGTGSGKGKRIAMLKTIFADETLPLAKELMYEGVNTLGKIKYEINLICDITEKTVPKEEEREEKAKKCLKMLELYSQMSFQRRFTFLAQLATTLQNIIDTKDVEDMIQAKAITTLLLIANNIKVTENQDVEVLKFLADPLYNYKRRFVINYYNSYKHQYNYLNIYWTSLQITPKQSLFVCSQEYLMGNCKSLSLDQVQSTMSHHFDFEGETFKPNSLTIPEGYKLSVKYENTLGILLTVYGPSTMSALKYESEKEVKKLMVSKIPEREEDLQRLNLCRLITDKATKKETPPHKSVCHDVLIDKVGSIFFSPTQVRRGETDESTKWINSYKSLDIPSGVAVVALGENDGKKFFWGPYYGPTVIEKGAGSLVWNTIKAVDITEQGVLSSGDFHTFINTICVIQSQNELCNLKDIDSSTPFLKMCKENGYCDSIPIFFNGGSMQKILNLDYLHVTVEDNGRIINPADLENKSKFTLFGSSTKITFKPKYDDSIWKPYISDKDKKPVNILQKLDIPDRVKVELWSEEGAQGTMYGMYVGPTVIEQIDGNIDKESLINSIKIVKVQD